MKKKVGCIANKRKIKRKPISQVAHTKSLKEARKYIKDTSLYIEYGNSEINRINKKLRNKIPLIVILEELGR